MSTKEKESDALSGKEMSQISGGESSSGKQGGGELLVGECQNLSVDELSGISGGNKSGGSMWLVDIQDEAQCKSAKCL